MKRYILLRDNIESGPYTKAELKEKTLKKSDLIWIENESKQWCFATEIDELKIYVVEEKRFTFQPVIKKSESKSWYVDQGSVSFENRFSLYSYANDTNNQLLSLPKLKENYTIPPEQSLFKPKKRVAQHHGLLIIGLMTMLLFGAFIVKKIIETDDEKTMNQNASAMTFFPEPLPETEVKAEAHIAYQHALSKEVVDDARTAGFKEVQLNELKKQVVISNNNHREEVFNGINDVQLTITNGSAHVLNKVYIQVTYFKQIGAIFSQEEYSLFSIAPGANKILVVPQVKKGAKVKYSLKGVELKEIKELHV